MSVLAILSLVLLNGIEPSQQEWDKVTESDGIEVKIGTQAGTGFPIFESTVTIKAEMSVVYQQLIDHENLKEIVYSVSECRRVTDYEEQIVVYYRMDLPWPVSDKCAVTAETYSITDEKILIHIESVDLAYQDEENLSKIEDLVTNWKLYKVDDQTTKVVYGSCADPGGIPGWVVKLFLASSPKETLRNLREKSERKGDS